MQAEIIIPFPLSYRSSSDRVNRVETLTIGQKQFDVKIPVGISVGQKLRLKGLAHHLHPTFHNDILLLVLPPSSIIYHHKRDVHLDLPLDPRQREKGSIQRVNLHGRKFDIKVPSNIEFGKKIRMGDMAHLCNEGYPGDIVFRVVPLALPKKRFLGIFNDFGTPVGNKLTFKFGLPGLFEIGREWEFVRTSAEIKFGTYS